MRNFLLIVCLLVGTNLYAHQSDTTYWKKSFNGSINFNQAAFSQNWTGGGINSLGLNTLINYKFNYLKGKHSWDNEIDLLYGFLNSDGQGFRKNNDRIYLDSKYGYKIADKWNAFAAFNILTQFDAGYKYEKDSLDREVAALISEFMAPGFFTFSIGFEYVPKPYFKIRLSPLAPRLTVVSNKELYLNIDNNYGVEIGKTTRGEWLAAQIMADFDKDLNENINLKIRYVLFANYETFNVEQMDHRIDAVFSAKIAKYFDVKLGAILVYDYDQDKDIQLSQGLSLGFVYSFRNFKDDK